MAPGSPFGPGIAALVLHLHITQAISFERLSRLMGEVFGLTISEGAIANILARAEKSLLAACVPIAAAGRESLVVGSDECLVPESRNTTVPREGEEALWQAVFMVQPEQRREFEPSSKRRKKRAVPWPGAMA